jgi:hypothetical protein
MSFSIGAQVANDAACGRGQNYDGRAHGDSTGTGRSYAHDPAAALDQQPPLWSGSQVWLTENGPGKFPLTVQRPSLFVTRVSVISTD